MPDGQQYFASHPESASQAKIFTLSWHGREVRFWTDSGVFSRSCSSAGVRVPCWAIPGPSRPSSVGIIPVP